MSNRKISKSSIILAIVTATLLFLLGIQMSWLNQISDFENSQFEKSVTKLLSADIPFTIFRSSELTGYQMDENLRISIDETLYRSPDTDLVTEVPDRARAMRKLEIIQQLLDSILPANGINAPYTFGTRMLSAENFETISDDAYAEELSRSNLESCINCIEIMKRSPSDSIIRSGNSYPAGDVLMNTSMYDQEGKISRPLESTEVLTLYFPKRGFAVLKNAPFQMGAATASILILFGAFYYLFRLFGRQKRLSEMKKDFVNNLTHELKTPIASILLSTKVLGKSKTVSMTDQDKSFLTLIQNEGKRLENQVDKVLQIAMVDSDNFTLSTAEVDLHTILNSVIESLQVIINQRNAQVSVRLEADKSTLEGDETHLFNLFYNLVENALKYSEEAPIVSISTTNKKGKILVTVADEGIGIDHESQEHIFDRFYRGQRKDIYKEKGFGLGLSYVKSIVDAHDGGIDVKSEPGIGSSFAVTLNTKNHE